jgi:hypothetical protein
MQVFVEFRRSKTAGTLLVQYKMHLFTRVTSTQCGIHWPTPFYIKYELSHVQEN